MEAGLEPTTLRMISEHADHLSAISPRWIRTGVYAIRTKPGSFNGGDKSPHSIFPAALTKDPTSPELHRGEPTILSVHSIGNSNSTPPFSYYQSNDTSGTTTWLP